MFDLISYFQSSAFSMKNQELWSKYERMHSFSLKELAARYPEGTDCKTILTREFPFYRDYVSKFSTDIPFSRPLGDWSTTYDWELLIQLIAASFASKATIHIEGMNLVPQVVIAVSPENHIIKTLLSTQPLFKLETLFNIYMAEQLNLELIAASDNKEKQGIKQIQIEKLNAWESECLTYRTKIPSMADKLYDIINKMFSNLNLPDGFKAILPIGSSHDIKPNNQFRIKKYFAVSYLSTNDYQKAAGSPEKLISMIKTRPVAVKDEVPFKDGFYFGDLFGTGFVVKDKVIVGVI